MWNRSFPSFEEIRKQKAAGTLYHLTDEELEARVNFDLKSKKPVEDFQSLLWDKLTNRRNRLPVKAVAPVPEGPKDYSHLPGFIQALYRFWDHTNGNQLENPDEHYRKLWDQRFKWLDSLSQ